MEGCFCSNSIQLNKVPGADTHMYVDTMSCTEENILCYLYDEALAGETRRGGRDEVFAVV